MTESQTFKLPDVGEGLTEAEIVTWHVEVGQTVAINDTLVDIETAKSLVDLPSPFAGVVEQILAKAGDMVEVGNPIIVIGSGVAAPLAEAPVATPAVTVEEDEKPQVLVGPGPKEAATRRRHLSGGCTGDAPVTRVDALPSAADPVELPPQQTRRASAPRPDAHPERPTARETRIPVKGVRKVIAQAMTHSAFTAPHVTLWLTVDMTPTMALVRRLKVDPKWAGVRVNPLLFVARAYLLALRSYPDINASWDEEAQEIVLKHYVNLGIAAATPRGLLVPNIKDAHTLDVRELAGRLEELIAVARSGRTQPAEMTGGTVTITNIGALGVDAGTPILNPGESSILAFGAVRPQPWVHEGVMQIRELTQLSMSFDHRLVDGELGSRVLARTGEILADPCSALLYG